MVESVGVRKNEIAKWVGISSAVLAICQCVMAVPWGALSDRVGRKYTILMGLTSTMLFSLMFGFSKSLVTLLIARAFLGLMNGNVGIIRTMVAEMIYDKSLQPRAFSIMPLVWTIGSIFGPAFGGALANPAVRHPEIFGNWEIFRKYPYALPNILAALFFIVGITTGVLFLDVGQFSHCLMKENKKLTQTTGNTGIPKRQGRLRPSPRPIPDRLLHRTQETATPGS
jgi:MFS family permease